MNVRVAVVQSCVPHSLALGLEIARLRTAEAAGQGATVVAFPETWLPGYPIWLDVCRDAAIWDHAPVKRVFARLADESVQVPSDVTRALSAMARSSAVTLVMGISERVNAGPGRGTLYNSILTFGPDGELLNHHRKLMPTYTERMVWGAGDADGLRSSCVGDIRVGALVCWEHWMPLARQALHECGEDIHVALWPTVHDMHQVASRQYAFEGRCFVLAAGSLMQAKHLPAELEPHNGKVAGPEQFVLRGGSAIIAPNGSYVAEPVYDVEALIIADLDLRTCREEQMTLDVTGHYHRPDLLTLTVQRDTRRLCMLLRRFYDAGLAQASYLVGCQATGNAIVIDANRDIGQYMIAATEEQLSITHVTETHIHADFVSGSRDLAVHTGAELLLSDEGG